MKSKKLIIALSIFFLSMKSIWAMENFSYLEKLPKNILIFIAHKLSAKDIVNLSKTNKNIHNTMNAKKLKDPLGTDNLISLITITKKETITKKIFDQGMQYLSTKNFDAIDCFKKGMAIHKPYLIELFHEKRDLLSKNEQTIFKLFSQFFNHCTDNKELKKAEDFTDILQALGGEIAKESAGFFWQIGAKQIQSNLSETKRLFLKNPSLQSQLPIGQKLSFAGFIHKLISENKLEDAKEIFQMLEKTEKTAVYEIMAYKHIIFYYLSQNNIEELKVCLENVKKWGYKTLQEDLEKRLNNQK